jgi:squalene-hopene/tetraprenyl-beta-curcumene cyclase
MRNGLFFWLTLSLGSGGLATAGERVGPGLRMITLGTGGIQPLVDAETSDWNKARAGQYLDDRAQVWFEFAAADRGVGTDKISCVSCHGMLPYALARPALRKLTNLAQPTAPEKRLIDQTRRRVEHWQELDTKTFRLYYDFDDQKKKESWGTEAIVNSLLIALDDRVQARSGPSDSARSALANLWQVQITEGDHAGSWEWLNFGLEPWETKGAKFFGATLAAIAVGTAPGYYAPGADAILDGKVGLLRGYLRGQLANQNLNNRIWMLWAATKLDGLLTKDERTNLMEAIFQKQQADGGWSLSSLGTKSPGDFVPDANSDGYATGLILHVLQTAGVTKNDAKVAKGLSWLRSHQEITGEWRASSVNKKRDPASHVGKFMSDAATAYAVLALSHDND